MSASEHRIYFMLQRVAHRLKTEADASLARASGLTTAQAAALMVVVDEGTVSQRRVAELLSQRESAVATMATRLLAAGFITRCPSPKDARAWELRATPTGKRALASTRKAFGTINDAIDRSFSPTEIEILASGFDRLLCCLESDAQT